MAGACPCLCTPAPREAGARLSHCKGKALERLQASLPRTVRVAAGSFSSVQPGEWPGTGRGPGLFSLRTPPRPLQLSVRLAPARGVRRHLLDKPGTALARGTRPEHARTPGQRGGPGHRARPGSHVAGLGPKGAGTRLREGGEGLGRGDRARLFREELDGPAASLLTSAAP